MEQHIIGIDLGTTNSTMAFAQSGSDEVVQFPIQQRISDHSEDKRYSFPSFYLFPVGEEEPTIGWYAKERGAELPDRLISSAKSWLCHDGIDRRSALLPLGSFSQKRSPVEVCSAFLSHLRHNWETAFPKAPFQEQSLLVTVPASFDPAARALVQEAAHLAHFPEIRLIEEPLAAFYAWLYKHKETWREQLKMDDTLLIVDIGGGTTDFSLIRVKNEEGNLALERQAVGNHLLLGGDNIDLTLAHLAQQKLDTELDEWQFQSLIQACRGAKEKFLDPSPPDHIDIAIQSRSSRLIGNTLLLKMYREEIEQHLVEGFFPKIPLEENLFQEKRSALSKVTLPYARDPRITVQLAHFLRMAKAPLPTAILFNGGTMKAHAFQSRLLSLLSEWKQEEVKMLPGADLEFGVSQGAVYYGWTRINKGIRVKAATCCSYHIGIEGARPAIPGVAPILKKICIVPSGMEEGSETALHDQEFALLLEEPVLFRFFSQNTTADNSFIELHPIETTLHSQGESGKHVLIKLRAKITELGFLELWCCAPDGRKWKLEFNIR